MKPLSSQSVEVSTLPVLRTFFNFAGIALGCLFIGVLSGYFPGRQIGINQALDRSKRLPGAIPCNPGPWGDLIYTPFTIAAPDEIIPVRSIETRGTCWFLPGYDADSFVTFLQTTNLSPEQQQQFLSPDVFHPRPDGIELTPPPDLLFALPDDARGKLYQALAQSPENDEQMNFLAMDTLNEHFGNSGVSAATMALFKRLCYQRGDYLMFSGVAAILSRIPTYEEKVHFAKALTRQHTMVLNLHITPQTDIDSLVQYWDRGCWGADLRTTLRSLTSISVGTYVNILMLLPPIPSTELYNYPNIVDNPLDGPPVNRDCAWTSFNFFRDVPDPNMGRPEYVTPELCNNYTPLDGPPRYGDLVVVAKPNGAIIHVSIYIADDIWFTKNGSTLIHPWMLSTASDVLKQFEFQINPGQHLLVKYFRNKRI